MKEKVAAFLKYCRPLYALYYICGTGLLNFIKLFIKTDPKLFIFNSFGGKNYNDSPRAIYEAMLEDPRFMGCRIVWAFQNPEHFSVPRKKGIQTEVIKADNLHYFITALRARCWVTNSSLERGLGLIGKNTYFVNTWHGTPLKKMGSDLVENTSFKSRNTWNMDLLTTQSKYESDIFTRVFGLREGVTRIVGLPRNDELFRANRGTKESCRKKLGLSMEDRVILYAPTFREYEMNHARQCVFAPPINWEQWCNILGPDTKILVRAHYETVRAMKLPQNGQVLDLSDHESINELMIASDLLISDYSSVFFDYAILERPMICFCYDFDEYEEKRGMYFDIRNHLDWGSSQEDILSLLKEYKNPERWQASLKKSCSFKRKFVENGGESVAAVLDLIEKNIFN